MRWKTKPTPKLGETRWVKKFAWFPVETDSGESLWLESYYVKKVYCWGRPWYADWNKIGWFGTQTVTPEEYDKLMQEEQFLTARKQQSGFLTALTTSGNFTLEKARKALQAVQAQYNHEAITEAANQLPDVAVEIGKGN